MVQNVAMAYRIQRIDYFYVTVRDEPGEAYRLLAQLADLGIGLLAFSAVPMAANRTQLWIFPEDTPRALQSAHKAGMKLEGPNHAILVQGDDELLALAGIHEKLYRANVNVYASSGVSDGRGGYGYVIYIKPEDYNRAVAALEI